MSPQKTPSNTVIETEQNKVGASGSSANGNSEPAQWVTYSHHALFNCTAVLSYNEGGRGGAQFPACTTMTFTVCVNATHFASENL